MPQPDPIIDITAVPPARAVPLRLRWQQWAGIAVMLGIFVAAIATLSSLVHEINLHEVLQAFHDTPPDTIVAAVLAAIASYIVMIGYDYTASRYAGLNLKFAQVAPISFCAFGLGNMLGFGALSSGAVRYRMYTAFGATPEAIARMIGFIAFGFGLGVGVVGAAGLLLEAGEAAPILHTSTRILTVTALILLGGLFSILFFIASGKEIRIGTITLKLPSMKLLSWQVPISVVDLVFAAGVLWFLLPDTTLPFTIFVGFFALATVLGLISHVPGGLGVFESTMLFLLKDRIDAPKLLAALVMYRIIYYVIPFILALALLLWQEAKALQKFIAGNFLVTGWRRIAPVTMAGVTFVLGVMLLASGVFPAGNRQLNALDAHLPLFLQEGAHFTASLAGFGLMILAQGLRWRSDVAWYATTIVLALNIPLSLAKGLAVTEATICALACALLLASRSAFYRNARLTSLPFSRSWWIGLLAAIYGMIWLLFFAYKHVEYSNDLWWQFESTEEAPRSLRAVLGVALGVAAWGLLLLLRPRPARPHPATPEERAQAAAIVRAQESTEANLANLGDKYFLFSASGNSFIMYGVQGRSWVALYDPVGPAAEASALIWRFRELTDRLGARMVVYEASAAYLPLYLDAGCAVLRLGEEAMVDLAAFDLSQSSMSGLRQSYARGGRDGLVFRIVPAGEVRTILPDLRRISDSWLAQHRAREKGFSLGRFEDDYIASNPVALVTYDGKPVAFASLLLTGIVREASIDLMRHGPDTPKSTMDFLFVSLLLHFKQAGYAWFNLGMAPLSGFADNRLAPLWHRLGRRFYLYGERFYNFKGLRAYKSKFNPMWRPRYLVTPTGVNPYLALADVTQLVSGGWQGAVKK